MKHSIEKPGDFERKARKWIKLANEYMTKPKTVRVNNKKYQIVLEEKESKV